MSDTVPQTPPAFSPALDRKLSGGCLMMLVVGGWMVALAAWMIWHLYGQVKEMRTFTDPTAQAIGPVSPSAAEIASLQARLKAFGEAITSKKPATLELTVIDLNHLLAAQEPLNRLKDDVKVEEITDAVRLKVALALNGMPFSGERLFLNAFITVRPEVKKDAGLVLLTRTIEVPGRTLSSGFSQRYLEANHVDGLALDELRKDDKLKALLSKITAIRCESGKVIAEFVP